MWGNSEVVSTRHQMLLFDAEQNAQGISDQRMRRRSGLQAVWQSGWMAWHFGWDPSLQLNLNTGLSEVGQSRQDRANQDFLQDHQESMKKWSYGLAVLGLTVGILGLLVTFVTAGMGTFIFVTQAVNVVTAAGSLVLMHLQELAQEDSTLTEEERREKQDMLSLCQGILGMVGLATFAFDFFKGFAASQVAGGLAAGAAQAVGMQRLTRIAGLVRAAMRLGGQGLRVLQLPALLRTADRVLAAFGLNGARLAQLGMTSRTRVRVVILELVNGVAIGLRSFLNTMQHREQSGAQERDDQKKQHESTAGASVSEETTAGASEETTQTEESCEMTDGSKWEWIDQSSDLNAVVETSEEASEESQLAASRRPAKRSQASHERLRYAPSGAQPVDVWFEGTERQTSRDLTESEEELLKNVKSEEDLRKFFEKQQAKSKKKSEQSRSSKFETRTLRDGSKKTVETERHRGGHGGDDHIQVQKSQVLGQEGSELEIKVETRSTKGILNESKLVLHTSAKDSRITGTALSDDATKLLLKKLGIPRDKVIIKGGQARAKEWDVNPDSRPGSLPGVDRKNSGSTSWESLIQTVLYLQEREKGKSPAEAGSASGGQKAQEAAAKVMGSLLGPKVKPSANLGREQMERLGYEDGKDFVIHDGKVMPKGRERGMESKGLQESVLFTVAYLQAKKSHGDEQAMRMAESPGAEKLVYARLQDFGTTRRSEFEEVERPSWEKKVLRVMDKVKKKFGCDSKQAHLAHQLSFDVMMEKVVVLVRNGDAKGLEHFVVEFVKNNNTLLEDIKVKDDPELESDMEVILNEQQEYIQHKLLSVLLAMHSTQSDEELHREVEELLEHMNSYVGNLRPGHGPTNQSIGRGNDLKFYPDGSVTPRSQWIHRFFQEHTRRDTKSGRVASSVTDPHNRYEGTLPN
ncbi:secA [Symbiodinium sp. CCMP2592]|nr:secA [Symbiodinium sp. CCMP2592]